VEGQEIEVEQQGQQPQQPQQHRQPLSPTRDGRLRPIGWGNSAHMDAEWPNTEAVGRLRRRLLQLGVPSEASAGRITTPRHVVAHLPVLAALPSDAPAEECSICLLPLPCTAVCTISPETELAVGQSPPAQIVSLLCMHYFHVRCIGTWLEQYSQRCPVCNTLVDCSGSSGSSSPLAITEPLPHEDTVQSAAATDW
jgi:hypothetical protein